MVINVIFSNNNLEFRIIDIFHINQSNSHKFGKKRNFSCISFRMNSNDKIISNGNKIDMTDGTVAFFPANVDYERISQSVNMIAIDLEMLNYTSDEIEYYVTKNYDKLCELFTDLYKAWTSPKKSRKYRSISILYHILAICNDECRKEEVFYKKYYTDALKYIHRNYGDSDLSIAAITENVQTNETYLRKAFKEYLGISPKNYIDNLRLKKAKSMLKSGYYSVKETANSCGFADEKYFSTFFLKAEGISPSDYKHSLNHNK